MKKPILWITPKWPLPAEDGARVAMTQLIRSVTSLGIPVDLLSIVDSRGGSENSIVDTAEAQRELGVQRVFLLQRRKAPFTHRKMLKLLIDLTLSPLSPLTLKAYSEKSLMNAFQAIWRKSSADWSSIVFDGMHAAALCSDGKKFLPPAGAGQIVYRAHNVETELWNQSSRQARFWPKKWALKLQAINVDRFEKSLVDQCDSVATVSQEDFLKFKNRLPRLKGGSIPIGIDIPLPDRITIKRDGKLSLLFLGRLDWPPNRDGLKWFLKEVWPTLSARRSNLSLVIAGKGDGQWLQEFEGLSNMEFLGSVKSTTPLYEKCTVSLVPIFLGSGTRVKVIESSLHRRACISTALGVEGTGLVPGSSYIHAETREQWIHALSGLDAMDAEKMGAKAFSSISKVFCPKTSAKKLLSLIET